MHTTMNPKTTFKLALFVSLLALAASACGGARPTPFDTPAPVTQVVTREVPQEVTRVVTRVIEVPVTVTPEPTRTPTPPPDPNAPPPPESLPLASLPAYTDCLYGPASWYEYQSSFPAAQPVEVVGRSADGLWLNIREVGGWNACWIESTQAELQNAPVETLPVVQPMLPISVFQPASPYASARRNGDELTLSWKAVPMSADEIRGYLIRANLCQGGQLSAQDIFIPMTSAENTGTLSYTLTDEGGCSEASSVHMISYTRHGFAYYFQTGKLGWEKVFFPPHP